MPHKKVLVGASLFCQHELQQARGSMAHSTAMSGDDLSCNIGASYYGRDCYYYRSLLLLMNIMMIPQGWSVGKDKGILVCPRPYNINVTIKNIYIYIYTQKALINPYYNA